MDSKIVIVVVGPTASGKTRLALRLAVLFNTEIISADSRQIYRELEIGTAKPSQKEMEQIRHHFINTKSIHEDYDAGSFGREAREVINGILKEQSVVIVCGGSGLYLKAMLEGFDAFPEVAPATRDKIAEEYKERGLSWLQKEVEENDPDYFEEVDQQNPQRLMRALEIIRSSGMPFSGFRERKVNVLPFPVIKIGMELPREELYKRIDSRMDEMIKNGLFAEAKNLMPLRHLNAAQTVGYQEVFGYLLGEYDEAEAIRLLKRNSRRYAKRQLTWFKKDPEIRWVHPDDWIGVMKIIKEGTGKS